jgi:hypothetical protein
MKYTGPKPLVEEHYHIEELIAAQEKRADDREYHRTKEKNAAERQKTIDDARMQVATDFYCSQCGVDYKVNAVLQVEVDWSCPGQCIAFYKGKHRECGSWAIRLITDKQRDGYFARSRLVRIDQGMHHNDLIQPHEEGFNLLYGKPKYINNK